MPEYPNFEDEFKQEETEIMDVQLEDGEKHKEVRLFHLYIYLIFFIWTLENIFNSYNISKSNHDYFKWGPFNHSFCQLKYSQGAILF